MATILKIENLAKSFVLHQQGGAVIPVFEGLSAKVEAG